MSTLWTATVPFLQMWDGDHMDGWGWGGWLLMSLAMLFFWAVVAAFGVWFVRSTRSHSHIADGPSALEIAKSRYARGEISDEEFERIKRGLSAQP